MTVNLFSQRQLILCLIAGTLSAGLMGGCSTLPFGHSSETSEQTLLDKERQAKLSTLPITHPDRKAELDELWTHLHDHTSALPISDNRIRIRSNGTVFAGEDVSEQNFLIRAAGETLSANKDGFVIMHIDYFNQHIGLPSLGPSLNLSTRRWIGNYEDFLDNRNEQNIFSSRKKIRNQAMEGVIFLIDEDEFPNRDRFSADEVYTNLLTHKSN